MKIKKPEDEKYFKDVVLKDILEEISQETSTQLKTTASNKKKKNFIKNMVFFILGILLLLLIAILFVPFADKIPKTQSSPQTPHIKKPDTQAWKMEEDRTGYKKEEKTLKLKKNVPKDKLIQKPKTSKNIKPVPKKKTEKELAIEALREQLLN